MVERDAPDPQSSQTGSLPLPSFPERNIMWRDPGAVIRMYKDLLLAKGEPVVERLAEGPLPKYVYHPTPFTPEQAALAGLDPTKTYVVSVPEEVMFQIFAYGDRITLEEHVAVIKSIGDGKNVPIRIHSSCLTGETFHATNCDCHAQMERAEEIIVERGVGGIIWLHQEGRGNGLAAKVDQLKIMHERGLNSVEAYGALGLPSEQRDFTVAAHILRDLGIESIQLITNSPEKIRQLQELGIVVTEIIPCVVPFLSEMARQDLRAKRDNHGHFFSEEL